MGYTRHTCTTCGFSYCDDYTPVIAPAVVNQWMKIDGKWYYFNEQGQKQTGWFKDGNTFYYLKEDGSMAADEWVENDRYYVDAHGRWIEGKTKEGSMEEKCNRLFTHPKIV